MISVTLPASRRSGAQWPSRLLIRCSIFLVGEVSVSGKLTMVVGVSGLSIGSGSWPHSLWCYYYYCRGSAERHVELIFTRFPRKREGIIIRNRSASWAWQWAIRALGFIGYRQSRCPSIMSAPWPHGFRTGVPLTIDYAKPHRLRR